MKLISNQLSKAAATAAAAAGRDPRLESKFKLKKWAGSRKMRSAALALFYVSLWVSSGSLVLGKRYMRCELARKLLEQHGFERSLLSSWICLLEHESDLDTAKVTTNPNGSRSYGLFQINGRYCQEARRGGVCNVKCDELLDENLREGAACAKRIQAAEGFRHWNGWQRYCRNLQNLPNLKVICGI